jgi:pimeloyl-ACP methyl ester carboxylesterase
MRSLPKPLVAQVMNIQPNPSTHLKSQRSHWKKHWTRHHARFRRSADEQAVLIELIQLRRQPSPKSKLSLLSLVLVILSLLGVRFIGWLFSAGTPNTLVREARRLLGGFAIKRPSIALILFGCLGAGLLLAVILVLVPFAGARENVISGVVLLAFAFGWASLAILSVRFTDQPQRWAALPAILSALVGTVLLLWPGSVTHDAFGWLWPIALLVLVAWMVVQSRRHLHSRARSWLLYPVFGVLALSAIGGAYETVQERIDRGQHTMPGRLVDVSDHRLHIFCTGSGSPTVVLEAALGEPSSMMRGWIQPAVSKDTRVCSYDRAGRGWSDAAEGPQDGIAVATDLHTLLDRSGESGPFVLAGHSAGGAYVLNFANIYPDDVAGVVLLDSMHPEQRARLEGWETFYQIFRRASALFPSLYRVGIGRLIYRDYAAALPTEARGEERDFLPTARHARSLRDEFSELPTALKQAGQLKTLGAKPLIVLTAGKNQQDGWQPLQDELATLSSNSRHRNIPDATHTMLTEDEAAAELSSQAIRDVLKSVRTATQLAAQ